MGTSSTEPVTEPAGDRSAVTAAEARAAAEARRGALRAEREAAFHDLYGDRLPGRWVVAASWATTAAFTVAALVGVLSPAGSDVGFLAVATGLFVLGCVAFAVDLVLAANRSRTAEMGIGGIFFLIGSAPVVVQRHLLGSFGTQVVVALVAAAIGFVRIDDQQLNTLAFGILVPMVGLGACGFWAARWGRFPDRVA